MGLSSEAWPSLTLLVRGDDANVAASDHDGRRAICFSCNPLLVRNEFSEVWRGDRLFERPTNLTMAAHHQ